MKGWGAGWGRGTPYRAIESDDGPDLWGVLWGRVRGGGIKEGSFGVRRRAGSEPGPLPSERPLSLWGMALATFEREARVGRAGAGGGRLGLGPGGARGAVSAPAKRVLPRARPEQPRRPQASSPPSCGTWPTSLTTAPSGSCWMET